METHLPPESENRIDTIRTHVYSELIEQNRASDAALGLWDCPTMEARCRGLLEEVMDFWVVECADARIAWEEFVAVMQTHHDVFSNQKTPSTASLSQAASERLDRVRKSPAEGYEHYLEGYAWTFDMDGTGNGDA